MKVGENILMLTKLLVVFILSVNNLLFRNLIELNLSDINKFYFFKTFKTFLSLISKSKVMFLTHGHSLIKTIIMDYALIGNNQLNISFDDYFILLHLEITNN